MSFSVQPEELRSLVSGFSGVLGQLMDVHGQISNGDASSVGHQDLEGAVSDFKSTWAAGVGRLHESLSQVSSNLNKTADVYEEADSEVRSAFRL
ncbi:MAG: WXG100 family type VII secretion target [Solirubrobacteraceae bacterium]